MTRTNRHVATHGGRGAFTLIELLVVIAIIAILAAILFPVFAQARGKARQTMCLSNLKQIGLAVMMYVQNYDELLPVAAYGTSGAGQTGGWIFYAHYPATDTAYTAGKAFDPAQGSIYSYIKNAGVFTCPSDSNATCTGNSYAVNGCAFTATGTVGWMVGKSQAAFDAPADFLLLTEEAYAGTASASDTGFLRSASTDDGFLFYSGNYVSTRHNDGANLSFVDSHTKWFRAEQVIARRLQTGGVDQATCP